MKISSHEIAGGADASSRTLVSGRARSRSRSLFGSGPASSPSNSHDQRIASASTGVNPPSLLASVIMLSALYRWWAVLMILRISRGRQREPGWIR